MNIDANTALLLIDVQQGFDDPAWGQRNNPDAEARMLELLKVWRTSGRAVIHVQHLSTEPDSPLRPGSPGSELRPETAPADGEPLFKKNVNSAFIGTGLEDFLQEHGIRSLVIVGMTTDHCVSTTVRMAGNLGFHVTLVEDATATFDRNGPDGRHYTADEIHRANLVSLDGEFCEVLSSPEVLRAIGG